MNTQQLKKHLASCNSRSGSTYYPGATLHFSKYIKYTYNLSAGEIVDVLRAKLSNGADRSILGPHLTYYKKFNPKEIPRKYFKKHKV